MDRNIPSGIVLLVIGAVSLFLGWAGIAITGKVGFPTPGVFIVALWAPHSEVISLGGAIVLQIAIDFVFWFAVIFAILWGVRKQRQ